jgi:hypothetical protein
MERAPTVEAAMETFVEASVKAFRETVMEASAETVMEVEEAVTVEVVEVEIVVPPEREDASCKKARGAPIVPRIPVPRIAIACIIRIAVIDLRQVLHTIAERIHALRVSDVVACLQIVFAGRRIGCSDRCPTRKARRTANRRTCPRVPGCGADGGTRGCSKQCARGSAANRRVSARLSWLDIADRGSRVVTALPVFLPEDGEGLSLWGKRHDRWTARLPHRTCGDNTQTTNGSYHIWATTHREFSVVPVLLIRKDAVGSTVVPRRFRASGGSALPLPDW